MTRSRLTSKVMISDQSDSRGGTTVDTFLIHHQAGTNDDGTIRAMVSGSKQVSANYTISNEGRITQVVDEDRRAWTSGSSSDGGRGAAWDRRSITVEIENESGDPDWRISDAALNAAAALLQDLRSRYRITNVLGHRDLWNNYRASYATYCPGPDTVAEIVARAGGSSLAGSFTELEEIDMATAAEIAQAIWTYMLTQTEGQKASGRAADWLVNAPDQVGPNVWDHTITHANGVEGTAAAWLVNTSDMVGKILSKPSLVIDSAKLVAALRAAGVGTIDEAKLVKLLDASLSDDFAAIPGAVRNAIVK